MIGIDFQTEIISVDLSSYFIFKCNIKL